MSLVELNLDVHKPTVRKDLISKLKSYDRFSKISMTASKESYTETTYKPGGLLKMVKGNWSGRVIEYTQEKLGRWSTITMEGKKGKKTNVSYILQSL